MIGKNELEPMDMQNIALSLLEESINIKNLTSYIRRVSNKEKKSYF